MGRRSSNYPPELRERAVRMVAEVRPDPPGTDTYTDCYGWREDAESVNSRLDDMLYRSRMPAYLLDRQHLFMLGHVLARNSIARALPRRSAAPPGELAA